MYNPHVYEMHVASFATEVLVRPFVMKACMSTASFFIMHRRQRTLTVKAMPHLMAM